MVFLFKTLPSGHTFSFVTDSSTFFTDLIGMALDLTHLPVEGLSSFPVVSDNYYFQRSEFE